MSLHRVSMANRSWWILNRTWSYRPLSSCSILSYQEHNCLSIFYFSVHLFAFGPVIPKPKALETWGYGTGRVQRAAQWNGNTPMLYFPTFPVCRTNRFKRHWHSDPTGLLNMKKKMSIKIMGSRVKLPGSTSIWFIYQPGDLGKATTKVLSLNILIYKMQTILNASRERRLNEMIQGKCLAFNNY